MRKLSSEKITAIAEERAAALAKQRAVGSKTKVYTAEEMKQSAVNLDKAPYDPRTIESMLKVALQRHDKLRNLLKKSMFKER